MTAPSSAPITLCGFAVSNYYNKVKLSLLEKGLLSLARLARFAPFGAGERFTHADCAAWLHLPLISQTTRKIYGRDFIDEFLPPAKAYTKLIGERPHARKVNNDRMAAMGAYISRAKK